MIRVRLIALACCVGCNTPSAGDEPETVSGLFTFGDFMSGNGIEHLAVCELDTDNCDTTDADGFATLSLPAETDFALTIVGGSYAPFLMPLRTTSEELVVDNFLAPQSIYELAADTAGLQYDLNLGVMAVSLVDVDHVPVAGYSGAISAGEGTFYIDDLGLAVDLTLTATSAAGRLFAMNVDNDMLTLTLDGPATCWPREHYWTTSANEATMPVLPGFVSGVLLQCD